MSVLLMVSSVITTVLIPGEALAPGGPAAGRALAYLAHQHLGTVFGTVYDVSTVAMLWFAGASALAGLLNLVPRYLPAVRHGARMGAREPPADRHLHPDHVCRDRSRSMRTSKRRAARTRQACSC